MSMPEAIDLLYVGRFGQSARFLARVAEGFGLGGFARGTVDPL